MNTFCSSEILHRHFFHLHLPMPRIATVLNFVSPNSQPVQTIIHLYSHLGAHKGVPMAAACIVGHECLQMTDRRTKCASWSTFPSIFLSYFHELLLLLLWYILGVHIILITLTCFAEVRKPQKWPTECGMRDETQQMFQSRVTSAKDRVRQILMWESELNYPTMEGNVYSEEEDIICICSLELS